MVTPRTILVVDDDQDGALSLGLLLEACGHEVTVRYSGTASLQLLETIRPEIVFLDLSMPLLNGYELCRHIRSKPWGRDPFIFALTGWMHVETEACAAGFDGCFLKPCSLEQLKSLLADPAAQSNCALGERRGPAAVVPSAAGHAENA